MKPTGCFNPMMSMFCSLLLLFDLCGAGTKYVGKIYPGFEGSQMNWINNCGLFLLSNNSVFALGFYASLDVTLFVLVIIHIRSGQVVWTANRGNRVKNTDKFVFEDNGNAYLGNATSEVWSSNTAGQGVTAMELQDNGNLVILAGERGVVWQSFSYPTDTLLPGQEFVQGMKLRSFQHYPDLYYYLEITRGDMILYAGYRNPQIYWSMEGDNRKIIENGNDTIYSAIIVSNSWNFYDRNHTLLWKFNISDYDDENTTWAAVLGTDGLISFYNLQRGNLTSPGPLRIPQGFCHTPEPCPPFKVCSFEGRCQCATGLASFRHCHPRQLFSCNFAKGVPEFLSLGERLDYFSIPYVKPIVSSHLNGCKEACLRNCSCLVLFYDNTSGRCFMFDHIGSLKRSDLASPGFSAFLKVPGNDRNERRKHIAFVVLISTGASLVIVGLVYVGYKLIYPKPSEETTSDVDDFFENVSGMPVRFTFDDLSNATRSFSRKLGQGGFGSVYHGILPDGSQVAVKKLEGIGQGRKEFRAEVSIIGSIRHVHLVKIKGFCTEGNHRLLVYDYMENGSLDRWIFINKEEDRALNWEASFNIVLGMAKGLAYLHEGCDDKIVHCDIKPENVLLDDNFLAKVSDFGLAKLMTREQSIAFSAVRGTRGYLAPEWIINHAVSEKSDVFSFGMVVLEIIGGRKNYEFGESTDKAHFPSYAFKKMEEGEVIEIFDPKLRVDEDDERVIAAVKVALWCVQDDMHLRPPMSKVVQMLEGFCVVPDPPTSAKVTAQIYSSFFKSSSEETTRMFGKLTNHNSGSQVSDVQLSGPR